MDILVVDDDLTTRKMLRFVLEQGAGHRVVEAEDTLSAERCLAEERFDLAMVDVVMPGVDGLELCRRIRAISNMPIIVVSARGDLHSRVRGLQLGADDYLAKPFDPSELAARVTAVLRRSLRAARADGDGRLRIGDVTLDLTEHQVELRESRVFAAASSSHRPSSSSCWSWPARLARRLPAQSCSTRCGAVRRTPTPTTAR